MHLNRRGKWQVSKQLDSEIWKLFVTDEIQQTLSFLVHKQTIPIQSPLLGKLMPTLADRGCRVVNATDPYSH
jgi:hypothetical protein